MKIQPNQDASCRTKTKLSRAEDWVILNEMVMPIDHAFSGHKALLIAPNNDLDDAWWVPADEVTLIERAPDSEDTNYGTLVGEITYRFRYSPLDHSSFDGGTDARLPNESAHDYFKRCIDTEVEENSLATIFYEWDLIGSLADYPEERYWFEK